MLDALLQLALFTSKTLILFIFIVAILIVFFGLLAKSKGKLRGRLVVKNINDELQEAAETILTETLSKKEWKQYSKEKKAEEKAVNKDAPQKKVYVLHFHGDIKASGVATLTQEINALLQVAKPTDEVVLQLESAGGVVHGYGLAAAQLMRIRAKGIPLTIAIDKVAASGGYMMACVADKILAAPFAIIGSIGVIVQLPNFNRLLKEKKVDFEQLTAGDYKRTLTMFGENTEAGREKLQEEIEDIHQDFKNMIHANRPTLDIDKVATGEHWLGQQALTLNLVDAIQTSDDYLVQRSKAAEVYSIQYEVKKPFMSKFASVAAMIREKLFRMLG